MKIGNRKLQIAAISMLALPLATGAVYGQGGQRGGEGDRGGSQGSARSDQGRSRSGPSMSQQRGSDRGMSQSGRGQMGRMGRGDAGRQRTPDFDRRGQDRQRGQQQRSFYRGRDSDRRQGPRFDQDRGFDRTDQFRRFDDRDRSDQFRRFDDRDRDRRERGRDFEDIAPDDRFGRDRDNRFDRGRDRFDDRWRDDDRDRWARWRDDWRRRSDYIRRDWWDKWDRRNLPFRYGWWDRYHQRDTWPIYSPWRYSRWRDRPYYWWGWTPANQLTSWLVFGWNRPYYWDYGPGRNIYYRDNFVYYDERRVMPVKEYYDYVYDIAHDVPSINQSEAEQMDWKPLGVYALTRENETESHRALQLAVNKNGIISGTYFNRESGHVHPVLGSVDDRTQRAAWAFADDEHESIVFESSLYNLTQPSTTMMVHFDRQPENTEVWHLVRLEQPASARQSAPNERINSLP